MTTDAVCHRMPGVPQDPAKGGRTCARPLIHPHKHRLVEAVRDYVHLNHHKPIGLAEAASVMRMNACYLSTVFSQTAGVTFREFLEDVRLAKAKELLRDPRNRISEVAQATGYASADAFRHAFKARLEVSPTEWRTREQAWQALDPGL